MQEEDSWVCAKCGADQVVPGPGGGRSRRDVCGGAVRQVRFVRGVERVRKDEPGTERFVISRLNAYIVGFEC